MEGLATEGADILLAKIAVAIIIAVLLSYWLENTWKGWRK